MTSDTGQARAVTVSARRVAVAACLVTTVMSGCTSTSTATPRVDDVVPDSAGLAIEVTRVSDGDSIRASSAEGDLEIRLIGVNAPEQDECFGAQSRDALVELLDARDVSLHPWPPEIDDFGRELGFVVADGVFVNLRMVEQGAVVARAQADHAFAGEFEEAERAASSAGVGLWGRDACGAPSADRIEIVDVEADAPGNDQENPNGEWVLIENVGDGPADLTGWALRDESTRHRYSFPSIVLAPGSQARVRTGCGADVIDDDPMELFWCDPEPPVWNNSGDTAFLLDPNGAIADNRVTE